MPRELRQLPSTTVRDIGNSIPYTLPLFASIAIFNQNPKEKYACRKKKCLGRCEPKDGERDRVITPGHANRPPVWYIRELVDGNMNAGTAAQSTGTMGCCAEPCYTLTPALTEKVSFAVPVTDCLQSEIPSHISPYESDRIVCICRLGRATKGELTHSISSDGICVCLRWNSGVIEPW